MSSSSIKPEASVKVEITQCLNSALLQESAMKRERGMATRTGINKQGWESSDFPVACDKCYGETPYLRMLKENFGQECRICFRPFTVFKWKGNKGVYKRTCVCLACSKQKNICQVCTLDLQFGLPMDIRDKRCGRNGQSLLNQNFLSVDNQKARPPPPATPPPTLTKTIEKQLVFVPEQHEGEDDEVAARIVVHSQLLKEQIEPIPEQQQQQQAENAEQHAPLLQQVDQPHQGEELLE